MKKVEKSNLDNIRYLSHPSAATTRSGAWEKQEKNNELKKKFYYGSDGQRVLMVSYRNDTIVAKKYYIGEYEYTDSVEANRKKEVTYISSPTGLVGAKVKINKF